MSRTRVRDQETPANPNAEAGSGEGNPPAAEAVADDGAVLAKPEKLSPRAPRAAAKPGYRLCKTNTVLRRLVDNKEVDTKVGEELELSEEEFKHFHATGCVSEVF